MVVGSNPVVVISEESLKKKQRTKNVLAPLETLGINTKADSFLIICFFRSATLIAHVCHWVHFFSCYFKLSVPFCFATMDWSQALPYD